MSIMPRSNVQPWLIALGLTLVVIGALVLLAIGWQMVTVAPAPVGDALPADVASTRGPSLLWAVLAGLLMAGGAAMVGIGMNRWLGRPRQ